VRQRLSLVRPGDDDDDDDDDDARRLKTRGAAIRHQPVSWYVPAYRPEYSTRARKVA